MRRTGTAIFHVTVPDTIIRSDWRGDGRKISAPKRAMSYRGIAVAIISIAQHASPNAAGHSDERRAQFTTASVEVSRIFLCTDSSMESAALVTLTRLSSTGFSGWELYHKVVGKLEVGTPFALGVGRIRRALDALTLVAAPDQAPPPARMSNARHSDASQTSHALGAGILGLTLAWLLFTLFWASEPVYGKLGVLQYIFTLALISPWLVLLVFVLYRTGVAASRAGGSAPPLSSDSVAPGIVVLATLSWLLACLLLASEPMIDPFTSMAPFLFGVSLVLTWPFVVVPLAYRAWKAAGWRRARTIAAYLLPLPVSLAVLSLLLSRDIPVRLRFELSEASLRSHLEQFESSGLPFSGRDARVGLYNVQGVFRRDGCVVLMTHGFIDEEGGFAYCTGPLPSHPQMEHLRDKWWIYRNRH